MDTLLRIYMISYKKSMKIIIICLWHYVLNLINVAKVKLVEPSQRTILYELICTVERKENLNEI